MRYLTILFLVLIFSSGFFYEIMKIIFETILSYIINIQVSDDIIIYKQFMFSIIKECIAPSAYIIGSILILSVNNPLKTNTVKLFWMFVLFSSFNIVRIFLLIYLTPIFGLDFFYQYHFITFQFLNGLIISIIILIIIRKDLIDKKIPVYSDIEEIIKKIN